MVLAVPRPDALQGLGVDAGPEQGEVADVPVVLAAGPAAGGQLPGLQHHVHQLGQRPAVGAAQPVDGVGVDEPGEEGGEVVDQGRVGDAQAGEEGVLGQPGEQPPQRVFRGWVPHRPNPRTDPRLTGRGTAH